MTTNDALKHAFDRIREYYNEYLEDKDNAFAQGICFGLYIATDVMQADLSTLTDLEDEAIKEMFGLPNIDFVQDFIKKPKMTKHPKFTSWKNPHKD